MPQEKFTKPKAIIFDMDGVLVDSERWWEVLEKEFLLKLIKGWDNKAQQEATGTSLKDFYNILQDKYQLAVSWLDFMDSYNQMAEQVYKSQCSLMPEVKMVLDFLKQSDIGLAIASSSFHSWIKMVLERFTLVKYFPVIVSAEDVGLRGKPAPDIYVYTVKKLNLQPKDCLVVEDSTNGVLSAKAAGTWVVGYRTPFNQSQDLREADISVKNLKDLIRYGPFSNNEKILGAFAQDFERRENGGVAVV